MSVKIESSKSNNTFFGSTNNIWTLVYIVKITISLHVPGYKRGYPRLNGSITGLTVEQSCIWSCGSHSVFANRDGQKGWGVRWATLRCFSIASNGRIRQPLQTPQELIHGHYLYIIEVVRGFCTLSQDLCICVTNRLYAICDEPDSLPTARGKQPFMSEKLLKFS